MSVFIEQSLPDWLVTKVFPKRLLSICAVEKATNHLGKHESLCFGSPFY